MNVIFKIEFEFVLPERYNVINVQIMQNTQGSLIIFQSLYTGRIKKTQPLNILQYSLCFQAQ
jgi:hypothetical protein